MIHIKFIPRGVLPSDSVKSLAFEVERLGRLVEEDMKQACLKLAEDMFTDALEQGVEHVSGQSRVVEDAEYEIVEPKRLTEGKGPSKLGATEATD